MTPFRRRMKWRIRKITDWLDDKWFDFKWWWRIDLPRKFKLYDWMTFWCGFAWGVGMTLVAFILGVHLMT